MRVPADVFALLLTALCAPGLAATWYVGPDGTGTNGPAAGTNASQPFATIAYATGVASDGDTIRLLAGQHTQAAPFDIDKQLAFLGDGIGLTRVFFPSNFTSAQNVHAFSIYAPRVAFQDMTIVRSNFLAFGAVIHVAGVDDYTASYADDFALRRVELVGGSRSLLLNPADAVVEHCAFRGLDAPSNFTYGQDAIALEIVGFSGTVRVAGCFIDGTLAGGLGGTRVRRAFQVEARGGGVRGAGLLLLESNIIYNVREPFLWDHYPNPLDEKASVLFLHNTVDTTEKTPFTIFAYGSGADGNEHLKFSDVVLRDNLFANIGGTSVGRSDYQYGNFARNFPLGGFLFQNNLLHLDAPHGVVDALGTPLATDPGWYGGAEFNTNGQPPALRFNSATEASPFADPGHTNGNFALAAWTDAGRAALGGATDGRNIGAWATPEPEVDIARNGNVVIAWTALPGFPYHAERSANLASGTWTMVGGIVTGGVSLVVTDEPPAHAGYYRVVVDE